MKLARTSGLPWHFMPVNRSPTCSPPTSGEVESIVHVKIVVVFAPATTPTPIDAPPTWVTKKFPPMVKPGVPEPGDGGGALMMIGGAGRTAILCKRPRVHAILAPSPTE